METIQDDCTERTLEGLSYEQFASLSDEQVAVLGEHLIWRLDTSLQPLQAVEVEQPEESFAAIADTLTFHDFYMWRKHGKPDRDISSEELRDFILDLVSINQQIDETYGRIPPEFEAYTPRQKMLVLRVLHAYGERPPEFNQTTISSSRLQELLGRIEPHVLNWLLDEGIVELASSANPLLNKQPDSFAIGSKYIPATIVNRLESSE